MSNGASGMKYQPSLDGLRAPLPAVGVILYRLGYGWARGGLLGVDTFFVLSGYLITTLLLIEWGNRSAIALAPFWGRRLHRLLPPLRHLWSLAIEEQFYLAWPVVVLGALRRTSLAPQVPAALHPEPILAAPSTCCVRLDRAVDRPLEQGERLTLHGPGLVNVQLMAGISSTPPVGYGPEFGPAVSRQTGETLTATQGPLTLRFTSAHFGREVPRLCAV